MARSVDLDWPPAPATKLSSMQQSANLDKSLDDLVSSNRKPRAARGGRGAGNSQPQQRRSGGSAGVHAKAAALGQASLGNAAAISANNRNRGPVVIPGRAPGGGSFGSKIIVSNLPIDVTEPQVKELFSTSIGPLKKVVMSFRANGTSTGTVTVEFQRAEDANRAYQQYNNRLIDGKKAIRIEVVVDPARAAAMAQQQAALAAQSQSMRAPAAPRAPRGGAAAGARGGRGAARGGRAPREPKPKKTLEDLDAEMEDYSTKAGEANQA